MGWGQGHISYMGRHEEIWKFHQYLQDGKMQKLFGLQGRIDWSGMGEGLKKRLRQRLDILSEKNEAKDSASDDLIRMNGSVVV